MAGMSEREKALLRYSGQFMLNALGLEAEAPFEYRTRHFTADDLEVASAIRRSIRSGKPIALKRSVDEDSLLLGFEAYVEDIEYEVAMVSWSNSSDRELFRHIAAASGTENQVQLPVCIGEPIARRARGLVPTTVLIMHNHPDGAVKSAVEERLGFPLGPSSQDREASARLREAFRQHRCPIEIRSLLFESGSWRSIELESAERLASRFVGFLERL